MSEFLDFVLSRTLGRALFFGALLLPALAVFGYAGHGSRRCSEESIFEGHGIEVLKRGKRFFIRYDAGQFAVQMNEIEVSAEEAALAQKGEREAYEILLRAEKTAVSRRVQ